MKVGSLLYCLPGDKLISVKSAAFNDCALDARHQTGDNQSPPPLIPLSAEVAVTVFLMRDAITLPSKTGGPRGSGERKGGKEGQRQRERERTAGLECTQVFKMNTHRKSENGCSHLAPLTR